MSDTRLSSVPKNTKAKLGEFVSAEGVIEVEKRYTEMPTETIVGLFKRENGCSNIAIVEHDLEHLNGCKVRVKIEVLEVPKQEGKHLCTGSQSCSEFRIDGVSLCDKENFKQCIHFPFNEAKVVPKQGRKR